MLQKEGGPPLFPAKVREEWKGASQTSEAVDQFFRCIALFHGTGSRRHLRPRRFRRKRRRPRDVVPGGYFPRLHGRRACAKKQGTYYVAQ